MAMANVDADLVASPCDAQHDEGALRAGHGTIVARSVRGRTALAVLRASNPLRLLTQGPGHGASATVCVVTFGGGLVDGDAISLDVTVEAGASLVLCTQASTKVFRGASRQSLRARVAGTLVWLPDPVACFRGSRFAQDVDVTLVGAGACVLLDGWSSGRAAYGERWAFDALTTRTRIHRDERLIVHDAQRLEVADGSIAERMDRFEAFASVIAFGAETKALWASMLERHARPEGVVAAPSPLARGGSCADEVEGAVVRIAATHPSLALAEVRRRLRNLPEIGVVDPFAGRR